MQVLVVNCGSSSIKVQLFEMPARKVLARSLTDRIGDTNSCFAYQHEKPKRMEIPNHVAAMHLILEAIGVTNLTDIDAVGHRVVHGGEQFTGSVLITDNVIASIERFADLAPLHNPPNLVGIRAARRRLPHIPHVACFDTAFHTTIPRVAHLYGLPIELYQELGIRRYGFHGTSHQFVARRAAAMLKLDPAMLNCISCHLGNGCSVTAIERGCSVDTSMGMTPLEGLVMGTRAGDFDPAILLHLQRKGYDPTDLNDLCNKRSGLLGLSGASNDMRTLLKMAASGHDRARLAIDIFCYRIKKYIGAYTAVLGRVDAVIFTGGVGEHAPPIRREICGGLESIGIRLDADHNDSIDNVGGEISAMDSKVRILVIPTDEEAVIADHTYRIAQSNVNEGQVGS